MNANRIFSVKVVRRAHVLILVEVCGFVIVVWKRRTPPR
jgi:hypothetical protein